MDPTVGREQPAGLHHQAADRLRGRGCGGLLRQGGLCWCSATHSPCIMLGGGFRGEAVSMERL